MDGNDHYFRSSVAAFTSNLFKARRTFSALKRRVRFPGFKYGIRWLRTIVRSVRTGIPISVERAKIDNNLLFIAEGYQ